MVGTRSGGAVREVVPDSGALVDPPPVSEFLGLRLTTDLIGAVGGPAVTTLAPSRPSKGVSSAASLHTSPACASSHIFSRVSSPFLTESVGQPADDLDFEVRRVLEEALVWQRLLEQFEKEAVRRAFIEGRIVTIGNTREMLATLRRMRAMISSQSVGPLYCDISAVDFLVWLMRGTDQEPRDSRGNTFPVRKSFNQWNQYLNRLRRSSYWAKTCYLNPEVADESDAYVGRRSPWTEGLPKATRSRGTSVVSLPRSQALSSSSSSSFSTEESSESSRSPTAGRSRGTRQDGHHRQRRRESRVVRDVVPPRLFDGSGGESLRDFLHEFEEYFDAKYQGNDRQKARKLEEFLGGSAMAAYSALDGQRRKYRELKIELLSWQKMEKVNQRSKHEREFESAKLLPTETLVIYSLRLERLAARVYSKRRERERRLRAKFAATVPGTFAQVLSAHKRDLPIHGKRLSWDNMKRLAASQDRQLHAEDLDDPPSRVVWYSRPLAHREALQSRPTNFVQRSEEEDVVHATQRGRVFRRTGNSPAKASGGQLTPCDWCGRWGHEEPTCWEKMGACLLCGSMEHDKFRCPLYEERWKRKTPTCSRCKGSHFGKDCDVPGN